MAFLIRTIHVGSAAFILGGAVLLILVFFVAREQRATNARWQLTLMQAYEWGFWGAVGLIVATGVGNLGHFGKALPAPSSDWGHHLTTKLALVAALLLYSMVRCMALFVALNPEAGLGRQRLRSLQMLYTGTAVLAMGVVGIAVALAHF